MVGSHGVTLNGGGLNTEGFDVHSRGTGHHRYHGHLQFDFVDPIELTRLCMVTHHEYCSFTVRVLVVHILFFHPYVAAQQDLVVGFPNASVVHVDPSILFKTFRARFKHFRTHFHINALCQRSGVAQTSVDLQIRISVGPHDTSARQSVALGRGTPATRQQRDGGHGTSVFGFKGIDARPGLDVPHFDKPIVGRGDQL